MIKYKGVTSNLLTELSLELGNTVDLNQSEHTLLQFFKWLVQDLDTEKKVQLICSLPVHLKPFCTGTSVQKRMATTTYTARPFKKNMQSILSILKKYMSEETFFMMSSCLPTSISSKSSTLAEKVFLVA